MSDPSLVVPVQVQAMVLASPETTLIRGGMDYHNLSSYGDPSPVPLAATTEVQAGVYLSWTLPAALRRAVRGPNGTLPYPIVPNRWLVSRVLQNGDGTAPTTSYWMIESDYLDQNAGTSPYLDPTANVLSPTMIGRAVAISADSPWQEPTDPPTPFLTAVAEANPYFAAWQPLNENVFSFFDPLGSAGQAACTISYYVIGWYADQTSDILATSPDGTLATLLQTLNWSASGTLPALPAQSFYQGAAYSVVWDPDGQPVDPDTGNSSVVAVGNTGMDGIVAMAQTALGGSSVPAAVQGAEVLEAFIYDLIPSLQAPGGDALIEEQVRQQWYASTPGETTWVVVDAPTTPGTGPTPAAPADQASEDSWLAELNAVQAVIDGLQRQSIGLRRQLYALWWKSGAAGIVAADPSRKGAYPFGTSAAQFTDAIDVLGTEIAVLEAQLAALLPLVPTATATITLTQAIDAFADAQGLPATRRLKAKPGHRFWTAADPVAVISNTNALPPPASTAPLACRWPTQLVTGLTVDGPNGSLSVTAAQFASAPPEPPTANLPASVAPLFDELFLLDTANAALFATGMTAAQTAALAASMCPPSPTNDGAVPPAITPPYPWSPPWNPLFLDWSVTWYDIPFANWVFDGTDYVLSQAVDPAQVQPQTFLGRSVLTPKPSVDLNSSISQYLATFPDSPVNATLQSIQSDIADWTMLSQRLGGLETQIAGWSAFPTQYPNGTATVAGVPLAALVGNDPLFPPNPQQADATSTLPSTYEGLRAGQFYFNQMSIVDQFGQVLTVVDPSTSLDPLPTIPGDNGTFTLEAGLGVTPSQGIAFDTTPPNPPMPPLTAFVELPPRLLQPVRLNFDFVPQHDGNPILGWILPNHIDSSLAVYGPSGEALGELILGVDSAGNAAVDWLAAPNSPYPTLPAAGAGLPALTGFLAGIVAAGTGALADFLNAVDETLWTVDPLGARADAYLSVLVGRPLAIVAAALSLELQSTPWSDPDWPYTFTDTPPLFLSHLFPVRLGDLGYSEDGLLGYFTGADFGAFNTVQLPSVATTSGYLQAIGPSDAQAGTAANFVELGFGSTAQGPLTVGTPVNLTMIVDPRASIHAQCGLVPAQRVSLDPAWVAKAMAAMQVTFRTGPSLAGADFTAPPSPATAAPGVQVIHPARRKGNWSWQEMDAGGTWSDRALLPIDATATLNDQPPTLREGRLTLSGGLSD